MTDQPVILLLAGGKSTRFWPLTEKNTYPFAGKNLVERHVETLKKLGFRDLIVVSSDKVFDWLVENSARFADFNINYVKQKDEIKGMAGAVLSAVENFRTHFMGRSLYVLNCNDVYDDSLHEKMLNMYTNDQEADILIAGYKVENYQPLGYLKMDSGYVTDVIEKPGKDKMPSNLAKLVVDLYRDPDDFFKVLEKLAQEEPQADDLYERGLDTVIKNKKAKVVVYDKTWKILKYPWHVLSVMDYFLSQIVNPLIDPTAQISDKATISGNVIISEGVKIFEGAKILGPCHIGKNTVIGDNSLVRESMVGENCVVGFSSEIARSYVGNNVWLHTNYVGDSVLENNVSFGSGAVTGNLRLDEEEIKIKIKGDYVETGRNKIGTIVGSDVRFGVNASIMPGVKIGKGSFVGPGVVLYQDLEDESFCVVKQELSIKKNKIESKVRDTFENK